MVKQLSKHVEVESFEPPYLVIHLKHSSIREAELPIIPELQKNVIFYFDIHFAYKIGRLFGVIMIEDI